MRGNIPSNIDNGKFEQDLNRRKLGRSNSSDDGTHTTCDSENGDNESLRSFTPIDSTPSTSISSTPSLQGFMLEEPNLLTPSSLDTSVESDDENNSTSKKITKASDRLSPSPDRKKAQIGFIFTDNPKLKGEKKFLKTCTAQLTISVGCSEKHNGDFFQDTIEKAMDTFGTVVLMVDDSLQKYTLQLKSFLDEEILEKRAIENGDDWLEDNEIESLKEKYGNRLIIQRWKDYKKADVEEATKEMAELYDKFVWPKWALASIKEHLDDDLWDEHGKSLVGTLMNSSRIPLKEPNEPNKDMIYVRHEKGVLYYHTEFQAKRYDNGKIDRPREEEILSAEELQKMFPNEDITELFNPETSLSWNELKNRYGNFICAAINPIRLGIDITARRFIEKKKKQPGEINVSDERALALVTHYLQEELGVMTKLWPKHKADFEIYVSERTAAMAAAHHCLIKPQRIIKDGNNVPQKHVLSAVKISGNLRNVLREQQVMKIGLAAVAPASMFFEPLSPSPLSPLIPPLQVSEEISNVLQR